MLKTVDLKIADIYVPAARRQELDPQRVEAVAEEIMAGAEDSAGQRPIHVRQDKQRYILVKGVHRLEARKALGDETIQAFIVATPRR